MAEPNWIFGYVLVILVAVGFVVAAAYGKVVERREKAAAADVEKVIARAIELKATEEDKTPFDDSYAVDPEPIDPEPVDPEPVDPEPSAPSHSSRWETIAPQQPYDNHEKVRRSMFERRHDGIKTSLADDVTEFSGYAHGYGATKRSVERNRFALADDKTEFRGYARGYGATKKRSAERNKFELKSDAGSSIYDDDES